MRIDALIVDMLWLSQVIQGEPEQGRVDMSAMAGHFFARLAARYPLRRVDVEVEDQGATLRFTFPAQAGLAVPPVTARERVAARG